MIAKDEILVFDRPVILIGASPVRIDMALEALPESLVELELSLEMCVWLTDASAAAIGERLPLLSLLNVFFND